jgi:hypothetical protein
MNEHDTETENEELSLRDQLEQSYEDATSTEDAVDDSQPLGQPRDEHGRFARAEEPIGEDDPRGGEPEQQAGEGHLEAQAPDAEGPQEEVAELPAPQSWKPGAREHWNTLPTEVREEVYRREHGMQKYLNQTAEERKLAQAFYEVYSPYEAMIRSEGADPLQAVDRLLQTSYQLRTAPPQQKAQLVAGIIRDFGVDVHVLDQALTGQLQQQAAKPPQQAVVQDPRVDQLMQALQGVEQQNSQERDAAAQAEIAQFAQSHEFLADVRDHMADLMEVAQRRGVDLSLEDAYNQACRLNPEIASVLDQRDRAAAAGAAQTRTARAREAASSVGGAPTKAPRKDPGEMSIREALATAIEQHAGG